MKRTMGLLIGLVAMVACGVAVYLCVPTKKAGPSPVATSKPVEDRHESPVATPSRVAEVPVRVPVIESGPPTYYSANYAPVATDSLRLISSPENTRTVENLRKMREQRLADRNANVQAK